MYKLILADGTELTGFTQNGTNYISETEVDVSVFENNLEILTIVNDEDGTEVVMHNAELIQQVKYEDGYYICFREISPKELQMTTLMGQLEYLAMMTDVDLEEV